MLVLFTTKDRIALLPYFFRYYLSIGATRFICCLFQGRNNPHYPEIEAWKGKVDLEIRDGVMEEAVWCGPADAKAVDRIRATLRDPWHVVADLDEFYWTAGVTLQDMMARLEAGGYAASVCRLVDRFAADGSLVAPGETLDGTYPLATNLTESFGACCFKLNIVRTTLELRSGHHDTQHGAPLLAWGECHHFKWVPGILEILEERVHRLRKLNLPWSEEGIRTKAKFVNGKLNFKDPDLKTWPAPLLGI